MARAGFTSRDILGDDGGFASQSRTRNGRVCVGWNARRGPDSRSRGCVERCGTRRLRRMILASKCCLRSACRSPCHQKPSRQVLLTKVKGRSSIKRWVMSSRRLRRIYRFCQYVAMVVIVPKHMFVLQIPLHDTSRVLDCFE